MSVAVLKKVRDALIAQATVLATFETRYEKPVSHLIGYKATLDVDKLPSICYVPIRQKHGVLPVSVSGEASLVIGILESEETDSVFDGVALSEEFAGSVHAFLSATSPKPVAGVILEDFIITTDAGLTHPFYQTEIYFKYRTYR
jgi:hypothetical protein